MKKILLATLGAITLLGTVTTGFAGQKASVPVEINHKYGYATGSLGDARNSDDGLQKIGCGVYSSTWGVYASCAAMDAYGNQAWCVSSNEAIVSTAQGISGDTGLTFWWADDGSCERLEIINDSSTAPKEP